MATLVDYRAQRFAALAAGTPLVQPAPSPRIDLRAQRFASLASAAALKTTTGLPLPPRIDQSSQQAQALAAMQRARKRASGGGYRTPMSTTGSVIARPTTFNVLGR